MVFPAQDAVTPAGSPVAAPIPVAPVVVWVMSVRVVLIQRVGVEDGAEAVLSGVTVIVPVALIVPHPPVSGMEYEKVPEAVGVPEMVMVLAFQDAFTPAGSPVAAPIPVAPVVVWVMSVRVVLIQRVGVEDGADTVLLGVTVIVPVALIVPHPPDSGIL